MDELKPSGRKQTDVTKEKIRHKAIGNRRAYKSGACCDNPRLYRIWLTMKNRCENPNRAKYADYGARGILVCDDWHDSARFVDWALNNGYRDDLQLDRIDNDCGYTPQNCRWTTPKMNSRNRRNTKSLTLFGETKCVAEWCESINVSSFTVYWWYRVHGREYAEERLEAMFNG